MTMHIRLPVPLPILMLYIGYENKGNLVGLRRVKEDVENLSNSIKSKLELLVSIYAGSENGKDYLDVTVHQMEQPVFSQKEPRSF